MILPAAYPQFSWLSRHLNPHLAVPSALLYPLHHTGTPKVITSQICPWYIKTICVTVENYFKTS